MWWIFIFAGIGMFFSVMIVAMIPIAWITVLHDIAQDKRRERQEHRQQTGQDDFNT